MGPRSEKSSLKRGRKNAEHEIHDSKKLRRSERLSKQAQGETQTNLPVDRNYLPTPVTNYDSTATNERKDPMDTAMNPSSQTHKQTPPDSVASENCSSSPEDTQPLSQFVYPPRGYAAEVADEAAEGVWGYLISLDDKVRDTLVLRKRDNCEDRGREASQPASVSERPPQPGPSPGGYLVGRHPECDLIIDIPTISNRHFLIFPENKKSDVVAVVEDLSSNGTFINDALLGRNHHRELEDGDEVTIRNEARFVFRYPKTKQTNRFWQQYHIIRQLGRGHFATVHLCVEHATGNLYAVKLFEKRSSESQKSQTDSLQQEIALLMGLNHPSLLCLKDTFDENDGVYLILELAPEGELFNLIITKKKLSEDESKHVFRQLFEGLKYLHDRGIVHRDIKPENILVVDTELTVKLGDFGLAKIIGEDSFTTTLCGTPSYVAPEILQETPHRRYTKAVDIWSLGVVLYICLCGFPPFSDELYTAESPFTMAQQIKMGRFDYPSPYWDSVGDPALDLIDRMLTVDSDKRISVDVCLGHSWLTGKSPSISGSTDSLTGELGKLDFSNRRVERERTLLSSFNDVSFTEHKEGKNQSVKVFHKNEAEKRAHNHSAKNEQPRQATPVANRGPRDFVNLGDRGDPALYDDESTSSYI